MKAEDDSGEGVGPLGHPPSLDLVCPFNPFKNNSLPWSWFSLEAIQTLVMLPVCVLRVFLWLSCMVLGYLFTKLAMIGAKDALTKPFPPWRRPLLFPVRFLGRVVLFACGFQWIRIKGKPAPRHQAPILVSNHTSFADPVFIFYRHLPVIVTAQENLLYPIVGSIMKAMQVISVNRVSNESRRNASGEIKRRAMCNDWSHVMIFPEATTTNGKNLVTFKTGAFAPGYPVQPMVIRYRHVHMDPSWVAEGPHVGLLLFRLMTQLHNYMEVEYLPVITPTLREQKSPRLFAETVRLTMAKALNVMVTDHGYEDAALAVEAMKRNVESGIALLEFTKFERVFHINNKTTKYFFSKFAAFRTFSKLPTSARGIVTYEDFVKAIALPNCGTLRQLFRLFDRNDNKYFNFKQYTLGLAFVLKHPKFKDASEGIFKDCCDKDGLIQVDDLRSSLREVLIPVENEKVTNAKAANEKVVNEQVTNEQILQLFGKIDSKKEGAVSKADFLQFLEANPEFVALFLLAKPRLISGSFKDKKWELSNGGGKDL